MIVAILGVYTPHGRLINKTEGYDWEVFDRMHGEGKEEILMKRFLRSSITMPVIPGFFFLAFHHQIHAYLDAGTGSIILQAVIGVLVGALFAIKIFWGRIKSFFGSLFSRSKKNDKS